MYFIILHACVRSDESIMFYLSLKVRAFVVWPFFSLQIDFIDVDGLLCLPLLATLDLQNNNIAQVPPKLGSVISLK